MAGGTGSVRQGSGLPVTGTADAGSNAGLPGVAVSGQGAAQDGASRSALSPALPGPQSSDGNNGTPAASRRSGERLELPLCPKKQSARQAFAGRAYKTGGRGRHILPSLYALAPSLVAARVVAVRTERVVGGGKKVKAGAVRWLFHWPGGMVRRPGSRRFVFLWGGRGLGF